MSAITAAVVGVILNLAIWFALHTLFAEVATVRLGGLRLDIPVLQSAVPQGNGAVCRRRRRDLPLQGFRDRDAASLRSRRDDLDAGSRLGLRPIRGNARREHLVDAHAVHVEHLEAPVVEDEGFA